MGQHCVGGLDGRRGRWPEVRRGGGCYDALPQVAPAAALTHEAVARGLELVSHVWGRGGGPRERARGQRISEKGRHC